MIQMNKKSVCRLLGIGAGKWADGLNQGIAPPDQRSELPTLDRPYDTITAGSSRKGGKWLAGMALTAALLGVGGNIFAQETSVRTAGTASGETTSTALPNWGSTSNATGIASRTLYAAVDLGDDVTSESLNLTGFSFNTGGSNLPTNATVVGIQVQLYKSRETGGSGNGTILDNRILLRNVGTNTNPSPSSANWTTTPSSGTSVPSSTYGGASQKWSIGLANTALVTAIRSSDFGLEIRARKEGGFSNREARIHGAAITVYYTLPGSITVMSVTSGASATLPATVYGTASGNPTTTVAVAGTGLGSTDITATLNSGMNANFEISKTGTTGTWGNGPLTYTPASGSVSDNFFIRAKAGAAVDANASGSSSVSSVVTFSSGSVTAVDLATSYDVTPKELTVTGIAINNKVYDRTASASPSSTGSLAGIYGSDDVTLNSSAVSFSFADVNAGTGVNVNRSGSYSIGGTKAPNYSLTQPTAALSANITAATLTATAITGITKVYDGGVSATVSAPSLVGVISPDDVSISGAPVFQYAGANANTGISVTATSGAYSLTGAQAGNYSLTQPTGITGDITQKSVTVTANADSKCFDAAISGGVVAPGSRYTVSGLIEGENVASVTLSSTGFPASTSGSTHSIIPSSLALVSPASVGNYDLTDAYVNGTLTITDQVKGRISGAANTSICNGSNASINVDQLGGGTPTTDHPFTGVFKILRDGTTTPVLDTFQIYGNPAAITIPASKLVATSSTTNYTISWSSLSNNAGCSTSATTSLTGSVVLSVYQVPTIDVTGGNAALCSGSVLSMDVTNPNTLSGSVYDLSVAYNGVTGGAYTTASSNRAFTTDIAETGLMNNTNSPVNVVYTLTAKKEGATYCASAPLEKTVTVNPAVTFDYIGADGPGEVCEATPGSTNYILIGLLPNTAHTATFDVTGAGGTLGQTKDFVTEADGTYTFSAADFNGGSPAPGTYTFALTNLEAYGCDLPVNGSVHSTTLTINPTPTFANVALTNSTVCHENLTAETFTVSGLLANKVHTLTFDITGDHNDYSQTATLTSDADGNITFTAADFNDGDPNPGTYTFTLTNLEVAGCSLPVASNNAQTITIKPTPIFDSLTATAASVCVNDLNAETMTIHGLLPSKSHTVSFTVTGEDESGAVQTATLTSTNEGTITFDGTAFNGGSPAVGNYTVTITGLEVDGCTLAVPSGNNAKAIEIKPIPTVAGISFGEDASVCISETEMLTFNVTGLIPNSVNVLSINATATIDGSTMSLGATPTAVEADALGNATVETLSTEELKDYFLTTFKLNVVLTGVAIDACENTLETPLEAEITLYNEAKVENLEVNVASVCADNRDEATFTINGDFAADVDYVVNYTVSKGGTTISTDDYTFNLESASNEINFPASIFAGSSVVPGNYTVEINSVTLNGCIVTFDGETKPSADLELTGTPVVAKANDTIYVGAGCATTMPDYVGTQNFTATSCIENFTVEQLAPNAPASDVIGFGGDRTVIFKMTTNVDNGGTVVTYDSIKVHIADTTRPTAIAHSTHTVYLNNSGTGSLSATAVNNMSTDNCTESASLDLKVSRGSNPSATSVTFACADKGAQVVTLHVKDASGNEGTATATVNVVDTVRPVITGTMPALTVDKGALCTNELPSYTALTGLSITDNCTGTGSFVITQSPAAGTIIAKSVTTQPVTITVADGSGNIATTSFTITYVDNTKPVLVGVPTNKTENTVAGECTMYVALPTVTATDNCTETVAVTTTGVPAGNLFPIGTTKVKYTATDAAGNKAMDSFTVTINPVIAAPVVAGEVPEVVVVNVTEAGVCAATVPTGEWPSFSAPAYPCATAGVTASETWSHNSDYEFPIGETVVTYTATYTYNGLPYSTPVSFTVRVEDDAAPVLATIGNQSFNVNAEGCNASIATTGMDVVYSGTCEGEAVNVSWAIAGTEYAGEGQISDRESNIVLPAGDYTVTYTVEDASGNDATTSFEIMVANPLDAMIEGTATVVKNALTTSTVKFTGEGGLAPYTFTYNVYVNGETTPSTVGATVSTLAGSDAVTIAQPNSAVGTFRYEVVSVNDANGCGVEADETHIFTRNATITVIEPTAADISMNVRIAPATLKSNGTAREVSFRLTNIGGSATTTGVVSFVVTKPRADVGGVPTSTLTATTAGWEVVPHANPSLWTVRSTSAVSIAGGNTLQEVKCNLTYTGAAKGAATVTAKLPNGAVGDSNNTNNSNTKSIIIN